MVIINKTNKGTNLGNILRTWCIYHSIHFLLGFVQTQLADLMTTELDSFFEEFALTAVGSETMFTKSTENFC